MFFAQFWLWPAISRCCIVIGECKCCTMKVKFAQGINKIFISKAFLSVAMLLSQKSQIRDRCFRNINKQVDFCMDFTFSLRFLCQRAYLNFDTILHTFAPVNAHIVTQHIGIHKKIAISTLHYLASVLNLAEKYDRRLIWIQRIERLSWLGKKTFYESSAYNHTPYFRTHYCATCVHIFIMRRMWTVHDFTIHPVVNFMNVSNHYLSHAHDYYFDDIVKMKLTMNNNLEIWASSADRLFD